MLRPLYRMTDYTCDLVFQISTENFDLVKLYGASRSWYRASSSNGACS